MEIEFMTFKSISVSGQSAFHVSLYIGSGPARPGGRYRSDSLLVSLGWERATDIGNTDGR